MTGFNIGQRPPGDARTCGKFFFRKFQIRAPLPHSLTKLVGKVSLGIWRFILHFEQEAPREK